MGINTAKTRSLGTYGGSGKMYNRNIDIRDRRSYDSVLSCRNLIFVSRTVRDNGGCQSYVIQKCFIARCLHEFGCNILWGYIKSRDIFELRNFRTVVIYEGELKGSSNENKKQNFAYFQYNSLPS